VAGTALLMWMGELISQRGIGNGMSMIIFASVVAGMPGGFYAIWQVNKQFWFFAMIALTLGIIVAVVFVELGQRRIPVQFAKRVVGRRMMGGQNTYIPLKVNQSGVIPDHLRQLDPATAGDPQPASSAAERDGGARSSEYVDRYILNSQNVVYVTLFATC
jgi:preprotein translocase subunit SecY